MLKKFSGSVTRMNCARSWLCAAALALWGALLCEPAQADYYAFGNTRGHFAILALNGTNCAASGTVCLSTNGFQGWVETISYNLAGPASNTNYLAGVFNGSLYNNFFGFDVAGEGAVTSATLIVSAGSVTRGFIYSVNSVTGTGFDAALQAAFPSGTIYSPNTGYYNDIVNGATYGTYAIDPTGPSVFDIPLDPLAVSDINAAIHSRSGLFAVGGTVTPNPHITALLPPSVPEPSTWVMMLAGFAALGVRAYGRRERRRVATQAC